MATGFGFGRVGFLDGYMGHVWTEHDLVVSLVCRCYIVIDELGVCVLPPIRCYWHLLGLVANEYGCSGGVVFAVSGQFGPGFIVHELAT